MPKTLSQKITKIRLSIFHQFSWPRSHKKSQKSDFPFFINFHDPGVTKNRKKLAFGFSSIFTTPLVTKNHKNKAHIFHQLSWPRGHKKSQKSDFPFFINFHDPGVMTKNHKILAFGFLSIFMTPGSRKITKIRRIVFHQFSWPRGHEKSQK